jgi:hypothetical protein
VSWLGRSLAPPGRRGSASSADCGLRKIRFSLFQLSIRNISGILLSNR